MLGGSASAESNTQGTQPPLAGETDGSHDFAGLGVACLAG